LAKKRVTSPSRDDERRKFISKTTMASSSFAQMFDEILRRELTAVLARVAEGEGLELEELVSKYLPEDVVPAKAIAAKAPKKKRSATVSINPEPTEVSIVKTAKCTSTTAKGKPCSLKAVDGECMCRVHLKSASKPAAPARVPRGPATGPVKKPTGDEDSDDDEEIMPVKKPKKVKKTEQPKHTHGLDGETHDDCELCQTHGSAMADTDDDEEFETVMSPPRTIRERLARVAMTEEYEDDEEEED
jgi:hypothetical protein